MSLSIQYGVGIGLADVSLPIWFSFFLDLLYQGEQYALPYLFKLDFSPIVLGEQEKLPNFLTCGIIHSLTFFFVQQIFVVFQVHMLCQVLCIQYTFPWQCTFGVTSHGMDSLGAQKIVLLQNRECRTAIGDFDVLPVS